MNKKVKTAIIASGNGSTANVIMETYRKGQLPGIALEFLVSTKSGASCLKKAQDNNVPTMTISYYAEKGLKELNDALRITLEEFNIQMVILAGCAKQIFPIPGIRIFNTHPADIDRHGGRHMYGLAVHEHKLREILDEIWREVKTPEDDFYTTINFHEVTEELDRGMPLMQVNVRIPPSIIRYLLKGVASRDIIKNLQNGKLPIKEAAKRLQSYVLKYEYQMLPGAVNLAAHKIQSEWLI